MARIRIAAVDAVAEDRHIGAAGLGDDQQFVHGLLEAFEHGLGLVAARIEEQDLGADLVDRDHAAHGAVIAH